MNKKNCKNIPVITFLKYIYDDEIDTLWYDDKEGNDGYIYKVTVNW